MVIFVAFGFNSLVFDYGMTQKSFGNVEIESLSQLGEDLSDQKKWFGKKKKTEEPTNDNLPDTLLPMDPIRLKLEDPDYDVRYEKGSIKPWHEIRSIYLRRQISPSNLAAITSYSVG